MQRLAADKWSLEDNPDIHYGWLKKEDFPFQEISPKCLFRLYLHHPKLIHLLIFFAMFTWSCWPPQKKMAKFLSRWFLWRSTVVSAPIELDFFGMHLLTYQTWRRQAMYFEWLKRLTQNPCILVIAPGLIWDVTIIYNRNESSSPNLYDRILVLTTFSFPDF